MTELKLANKPASSRSKRKEPKAPNLRNLIYAKKWDVCVKEYEKLPEQAKIKDRMGDLPLHEACNSGAPFHVVKGLHQIYPDAIQEKGFCGRLPLHYAAYSKPSLHTIKFLLGKYPEAAEQFDADGRLPIHLAVVRNAPKDSIQTLVEAFPKSLTIPNKYGNTPHMLARNEHVYELLQKESAKPRNITQKLEAEKKLMGVWSDGSKSPVQSLRDLTKHPTGSKSPVSHASSTTADTTSTTSSNPVHESSKIPPKPSTPPKRNYKNNNKISPTTKEFFKTTHMVSSSSPKRKNQTYYYKSTSTLKTSTCDTTYSNNLRPDSNTTATTASHSTSGTNVRRRDSLRATCDDINHLEKSTNSSNYHLTRFSPKSTLDYVNTKYSSSRNRRPRSSYAKKEIISTKKNRKILPSPTRSMVVHPVWK